MNIFDEAAKLQMNNTPFALTTIISSKGSTPRNVAKMIVKPDTSILGTIGGGLMEANVIKDAVDVIKNKESRSVSYALNRNAKNGLELDCGGNMTVFIEYIGNSPELILVGGGHVNLAIAKIAHQLKYSITIVENRQEFATQDRFPFVNRIYYDAELEKALERVTTDSNTYIVVATGVNDEITLRHLISKQYAYLGMVGSRRKVATTLKNLKKDKFSDKLLEKLHAPIGLNIGGESPEEIAISVLSEIMMIRSNGDGKSKSEKNRKNA